MTKRNAILLSLFIGVLAVAAPIITALSLARQEGMDSQMAAVGAVATEVLRRADEAGDQGGQAIAMLRMVPTSDPCSNEKLQLMGAVAIASDQLQGVGYVADDQLLCSSLGFYGSQLPIGPPDYRSATGAEVRTSVKFPLATDQPFMVLATDQQGFALIINPQLVLDLTLPGGGTSLGLYSYSNRHAMTVRGYFDPRWIDKLGREHQKDFVDGKYLVSLRRSAKYDMLSFAAIPLSSVDPILRRQAKTLVPIGVIAGLVLAAAVFLVARVQLALPAVLKAALRRKEFCVVYQPVVDLRTRQWVGAEVLVRWRRPGGEMVRPDVFIPVAEDSGLIHRLTTHIMEIVGREAASLFVRYPEFHLSINLSAADLEAQDTVQLLEKLIGGTQAKDGNLIIEATERILIKTGAAQEVLREVRSHGVRVAIDDFGTGYSSLSYLQTFPIDILKIDKSFVDTIGVDAATSQVIFHIIEMAKSLELKMTAEGVETEAQAAVLRDHMVQFAQGSLFAKPLEFDDLMAQLSAANSSAKARNY